MVTKIELIGPWAMPYPPRNFVKIRSQLFQLFDGQTDKQTDRSENITSHSTEVITTTTFVAIGDPFPGPTKRCNDEVVYV